MKVSKPKYILELGEDDRDELVGILKKFQDKCSYSLDTTGVFIEELLEELR